MESISQILNFKKDIEQISLNMFKIESELNILELISKTIMALMAINPFLPQILI